MELIGSYISELSTALRGPRREKLDLLAESRDSLADAAEAYERDGVPPPEAERAAGDRDAAVGADVTVVARDVAFERPPSTMPAGELRVALVNQGWAEHDLTFAPSGRTVAAARGRSTDAGTLTLEPGTYAFYCSVQGHRQAGMEFRVEVT